jgi:transposase
VRRYARSWAQREGRRTAQAYVPLSFAPGEAYQFDWSHEVAVIDGVTTKVKVAQMRLCYSRMPFVRVYPREAQEMVFDAHEKAFAFFKGSPTRGIVVSQTRLRHDRHEDGGRDGVRRQGAPLQPPL